VDKPSAAADTDEEKEVLEETAEQDEFGEDQVEDAARTPARILQAQSLEIVHS
jgi:hypothetical protein